MMSYNGWFFTAAPASQGHPSSIPGERIYIACLLVFIPLNSVAETPCPRRLSLSTLRGTSAVGIAGRCKPGGRSLAAVKRSRSKEFVKRTRLNPQAVVSRRRT